MFVPTWALGAVLAFLLVQFSAAGLWAIRADRQLAIMEAALETLTTILTANNLAVLAQRMSTVEHAVEEQVNAHARNRERIEGLHKEVYVLFGDRGSHSSAPRSEG